MHDKKSQAVQASLLGNWEEAIALNTELLESNPHDTQAMNRLGRAYTELGQIDSAREIYQKVLSVDKYNPVALRSLKNLSVKKSPRLVALSRENFIEEPGITRTAELIKVASRDTLLSLSCKELLTFVPRSRLIALHTDSGATIGCLPDDLSLRLAKLVKSGYNYSVCVKAVGQAQVSVFIRETKRPSRATAAPSFSRTIRVKPTVKTV